jgi:hypothetical protein
MRLPSTIILASLAVSLTFLTACGGDSKSDEPATQAAAPPPEIDGPVLLRIIINEDILPAERIERYEAPLRKALTSSGLGEIKQSGEQFNDDWRVLGVVIVTEVNDVAKGVALIRKKLREQKAPQNTVIQQLQPYQYVYQVYDT